ncbi:hypothetical protein [Nocardia sp. NPDC051832]|uniref:hypothetical protein n=1 Tax=Nocardia sp. NPDC051832 TaxID=3155673 RepID=UPI003419F23C
MTNEGPNELSSQDINDMILSLAEFETGIRVILDRLGIEWPTEDEIADWMEGH